MQSANGLFGKEVVVRDTGEKQATVKNLVFDGDARSVVALLISGGLFDSSRVVRWDSIVSLSDVVVVREDAPFEKLKDDPEVENLHRHSHKITGTEIIHAGEKIGTVDDIFVDDSGLVVGYEVKEGMLSSNKFLLVEEVESSGKDAIVVKTADLPLMKDVKR
ncbi:MAG: PRC-barrel domain-containing protein [Rubrobacteraceae bacterium]